MARLDNLRPTTHNRFGRWKEAPDLPRQTLDEFLAQGGNIRRLPIQEPVQLTVKLRPGIPQAAHSNGNRSSYK